MNRHNFKINKLLQNEQSLMQNQQAFADLTLDGVETFIIGINDRWGMCLYLAVNILIISIRILFSMTTNMSFPK